MVIQRQTEKQINKILKHFIQQVYALCIDKVLTSTGKC